MLIICIFRAFQDKTHINGVQFRKFIVIPREFDIIKKNIFPYLQQSYRE